MDFKARALSWFTPQTRRYEVRSGNVRYLDGSSLERPSSMPPSQRTIAAVIVAIGIGIGIYLLYGSLITPLRQVAQAQASVEENLARPGASESLPNLAELIPLDATTMASQLESEDVHVIDLGAEKGSNAIELFKPPNDMSSVDCMALWSLGVSNLNAAQASRLLNGSWVLQGAAADPRSLIVRYCDFSAGSVEAALQTAIAAAGFDANAIADSGVDDAGNTYAQGSIATDVGECPWQVSALPLSSVYDIAGLPDNAYYVGVRLTAP